jgi:hypothetical protein
MTSLFYVSYDNSTLSGFDPQSVSPSGRLSYPTNSSFLFLKRFVAIYLSHKATSLNNPAQIPYFGSGAIAVKSLQHAPRILHSETEID